MNTYETRWNSRDAQCRLIEQRIDDNRKQLSILKKYREFLIYTLDVARTTSDRVPIIYDTNCTNCVRELSDQSRILDDMRQKNIPTTVQHRELFNHVVNVVDVYQRNDMTAPEWFISKYLSLSRS